MDMEEIEERGNVIGNLRIEKGKEKEIKKIGEGREKREKEKEGEEEKGEKFRNVMELVRLGINNKIMNERKILERWFIEFLKKGKGELL